MTRDEAIPRLNTIMAHLWMVRNFLKHAEEIEEDEAMLEVHRMIFDFIRATEPANQRGDVAEYLHRVRAKLPKLKKVAEYFASDFRRVSSHTNFEMAAASLSGSVQQIEEILAAIRDEKAATDGPSGG
jgi:hypothetical protein